MAKQAEQQHVLNRLDLKGLIAFTILAHKGNMFHKAPGYLMEKAEQMAKMAEDPARGRPGPRALLDLEGQREYDEYMDYWQGYLRNELQPEEAP